MSSTAVNGERPEPVLNAAVLAGEVAAAIVAIGMVLRALGLLSSDVDLQQLSVLVSNVVLTVGAVWATVGPYLTARYRARNRVTPLADPRDAHGRPLVIDGEVAGPPVIRKSAGPVDIGALYAEYFPEEQR